MHRMSIEEVDKYYLLVGNEQVVAYISGNAYSFPEAYDRLAAIIKAHPDERFGMYSVEAHESGRQLGIAKIARESVQEVEIGYALLPDFWGKGYATEIGQALVAFCREQFPELQIMAKVHPANLASIRVLEKLGMEVEMSRQEPDVWMYVMQAK